MHDDDTPLTEQELEDARRGQELVAAAVADTRAPQAPAGADRARPQPGGRAIAAVLAPAFAGPGLAPCWPRP